MSKICLNVLKVMGQVDQNVATDNNTSNVKTTPASTKQELLSGAGKVSPNLVKPFLASLTKSTRHAAGY